MLMRSQGQCINIPYLFQIDLCGSFLPPILELHPELCDLIALVREVVEDQHALTPQRQILFEQNQLEALVLVDPDRLRQVITNYLSNALKYSASDQPVFVRIALLETYVLVEVEDKEVVLGSL